MTLTATSPEFFFLPYQAAWIKDNARIKIMEKSRQIGMSWAAAYRAVTTTSRQGVLQDTWVSSRDELQAKTAPASPASSTSPPMTSPSPSSTAAKKSPPTSSPSPMAAPSAR